MYLNYSVYAALAGFEREENEKKAAARLRRQRKPKSDSLKNWVAQESSFLTKLPQEIRHMIYREAFAMLSQIESGELLVVTSTKRKGRRKVAQTKILPKGKAPPLGIPSLFLVCKQIREEAKPIFWSSMTFICASSVLYNFCVEKQLPHHRRKENIPALFPVQLVRNIEVWIPRNVVPSLSVLKRLWALAKVAHDSLNLKIRLYNMKNEGEPLYYLKNGSALALYHQIREYQTWRKQRGMSLDVQDTEFCTWFTEDHLFEVCFPGFSDKIEERMDKEKGSSDKPVLG
ncbi:hypothetical protein KCU67_g3211, partial [Aureobasidium melanogenum]